MSPLVTFGPNFEKPAKCRREEERRRWLGGAGAACTVPWFQSSSLHRLSGACVVWHFFYFFVQLRLCSCSFSNPQYNGNSHKFILIKKIIYFCLQFNTFVFYIQMITRFVQILCDLCHVSDFLYFSGQYKWCCLSFTNNLLVSFFLFFLYGKFIAVNIAVIWYYQ